MSMRPRYKVLRLSTPPALSPPISLTYHCTLSPLLVSVLISRLGFSDGQKFRISCIGETINTVKSMTVEENSSGERGRGTFRRGNKSQVESISEVTLQEGPSTKGGLTTLQRTSMVSCPILL